MSLEQGKDYKAEDWTPPEGLGIGGMVAKEGKPEIGVDVDVGEPDGDSSDVAPEQAKANMGSWLRKLPVPPLVWKIAVVGVFCVVVVVLVGMVKSKSGSSSEEPTPAPTQGSTYQPPVEVNVFHYTVDELAELRVNGYTADEAEYYESLEIPVASLIADAQQKRKELLESEMAPYIDATSDEFKELSADTWVGQPEFELNGDTSTYRYYSEVWNMDYKKLPARGKQLFIKLILSEQEVFFMAVTPEQYLRLENSGNIVVDVKYTQVSEGVRVITDIREKDISN